MRSAPAEAYCRGAFIGHLLEDFVDALPDARADRGSRQTLTPDEPSPDSFFDRLQLVLLGKAAFGDDVGEGAKWGGDADSSDRRDVGRVEATPVQAQRVRGGRHSLKSRRHRHVQLRRHDVRQLVQRQCGRVTVDALRLAVAVL